MTSQDQGGGGDLQNDIGERYEKLSFSGNQGYVMCYVIVIYSLFSLELLS